MSGDQSKILAPTPQVHATTLAIFSELRAGDLLQEHFVVQLWMSRNQSEQMYSSLQQSSVVDNSFVA